MEEPRELVSSKVQRKTLNLYSSHPIYIYIYLSIKQDQYLWGVRRRGKTGKHGKVGVKREKVVTFSPTSIFPARK